MKQFSCGDVVPGCRRTFQGADEEQVLRLVAAHAGDDHGLRELSPGLVDQVRRHVVSV